MYLKAIKSVLALAVAAAAVQAHATTITFDDLNTRNNFDTLGISNTYLGYQWSSSGTRGEGWAVATTSNTISGPMSAPVSGNTIAWNWNGVQSLFINFGAAMNVSGAWIATGFGASDNTSVTMYGYDARNNLVATSAALTPAFNFQYLSSNFTDISRLEFRAGSSNRWFAIDSIDVKPVPEPASIALIGVGLAAIGLMRRKKA